MLIWQPEIGQRVTTKWTFKNDGSWRTGRIHGINLAGVYVLFDDGRTEWFLRSTFRECFEYSYDYPHIAPPRLTDHQRTLLQAAAECDSLNSKRHRLQDLNRLAKMGLIEAVDSEPDYSGNLRRSIVIFCITNEGRAITG